MPPGCSAPLGVLHDLPRLGQVEHDPVEVGLVDALVAVAELDAVALERLGAEERRDVRLGPVGEVLAELVADDVGAGPQHRHRQRARPDARLEDPGAREDVGQHQDRAEVLGIDHLRATGHLEHEVRQRRAHARGSGLLRVERTVMPSGAPMSRRGGRTRRGSGTRRPP